MKRTLFTAALAAAVLAAARAEAAPQVEADPGREYWVSPEVGPWMILAASYSGPSGKALARDFALELRKTYNLPAFIWDSNQKEREEQQARIRKIHEEQQALIQKIREEQQGGNSKFGDLADPVMRPRIRMVRIPEQYGVLVGGYPDMETARESLDDIKKAQAPPAWRRFMNIVSVGHEEKKMYENPLLHAFVVRNPTVPQERPQQKGPDPFLKKLNADEEYSLLRCRKPWTLAVKEFHGPAVLTESQAPSSSFLNMLGLGTKASDVLTASALQAHEVAKVMRQMKFEAYVLHTRNSSVVTVGGFDSPTDAQLRQLQRKLANLEFKGARDPLGMPLRLFAQPLPMQVPQF